MVLYIPTSLERALELLTYGIPKDTYWEAYRYRVDLNPEYRSVLRVRGAFSPSKFLKGFWVVREDILPENIELLG